MIFNNPLHQRTLTISFSPPGFSFAVLDGPSVLVEWGVKKAAPKNKSTALQKIARLISIYTPQTIILEDLEHSRVPRSPKVQDLSVSLAKLAGASGITLKRLPMAEVKRALLGHNNGTKHDVALKLAARFPDELAHLLPPKRRIWENEHYRMGIFEAVAFGIAYFSEKKARAEAK